MHRKIIFFILSVLFSLPAVFLPSVSPAQSPAMPKAAAPAEEPTSSGTVMETMSSSGYTYLLVENGAGKTWLAIPETSVKKGDTVEYYQGMVMDKFTSKTLNRTFESIVFSPGLVTAKAKAARQTAQAATDGSFAAAVNAEKATVKPDISKDMSIGSAGSNGAIVPLKDISIEKVQSANGYSVGEIFAKAGQLAGKKVQVRGKVVKFNPMIMGKNWVHLQDGTGDPMQNSHDLVVTTQETVEVDSTITIEGVLAADKDFGAGYKYAAIVEDAVIVK